MSTIKTTDNRSYALEDWYNDGGIMIMGYEMYRNLSTLRNIRKAKHKKTFTKTLVDPGTELGHVLMNQLKFSLCQWQNNKKKKKFF